MHVGGQCTHKSHSEIEYFVKMLKMKILLRRMLKPKAFWENCNIAARMRIIYSSMSNRRLPVKPTTLWFMTQTVLKQTHFTIRLCGYSSSIYVNSLEFGFGSRIGIILNEKVLETYFKDYIIWTGIVNGNQ